ncbi:MAG TPA: hypothetical protein ENI54_03515 [bacterium]|nr:hypothetical protein [bacterium]
MDIDNLNAIEERIILIKESFERMKMERDQLLTEVKAKDDEINELKDKMLQNEAGNDIVIKKIDSILNNLETIQL